MSEDISNFIIDKTDDDNEVMKDGLEANDFGNEDDNIFSGRPSKPLNHRPFFSVVIACYNSRKYISKALQSIVNQHMDDDIEVILVDDCSTEDYSDQIEPFNDILSIKRYKTEYNFCPGNTKQKGASEATGQWLCFCDHDDLFIENAFQTVKQAIINSGEEYYVMSKFVQEDIENEKLIMCIDRPLGWTHGKFYNLDNLWNKFKISYPKDLTSHEDIAITTQTNCIFKFLNREATFVDDYTYIWNFRSDSTSKQIYHDKETNMDYHFLEFYYHDYLKSTGWIYLDQFKKQNIPADYTIYMCAQVLIYAYSYMQSFLFYRPHTYLRRNVIYAGEFLAEVKRLFNVNNQTIWNIMANDGAQLFCESMPTSFLGSNDYIPTQTIKQWMDMIDPDYQEQEFKIKVNS